MRQLDIKIPQNFLRQYASQLDHVAHGNIKVLQEVITGEQSDEYYQGFLAGITFGRDILFGDHEADPKTVLEQTMAYVADLMTKREMV